MWYKFWKQAILDEIICFCFLANARLLSSSHLFNYAKLLKTANHVFNSQMVSTKYK